MEKMLETLCAASGVSGAENNACEAALSLLRKYAPDAKADKFGCVSGYIGDPDNGKPTVMLEAHIDEIGFIVTYIDDNGFLRVGNCGGTDRRLYAAQTVTIHTINGDIKGVICTLPPHVASDSSKTMQTEEIAIDAGFPSRKEAEKIISAGDRVTIDNTLAKLCGTRVTSKALDNRAGVAAVLYALELIQGKTLPYNIEVLFASQEEVRGRGAIIAAFNSSADIALVTDVSFAYTSDDKKQDCGTMGKGAMIGISPVLDNEVTNELKKLAKDKSIPYQCEVMGHDTGTDADHISISHGGIRTGLISIPIKYMHTPVEVADTEDIKAVGRLMAAFITGGESDV